MDETTHLVQRHATHLLVSERQPAAAAPRVLLVRLIVVLQHRSQNALDRLRRALRGDEAAPAGKVQHRAHALERRREREATEDDEQGSVGRGRCM